MTCSVWLKMAAMGAGLAALQACSEMDRNVARADDFVVPVTVGETRVLTASQVANAMIKAGFTYDEIVELGPGLRNAVSTRGGAEVRRGKYIHALFSVQNDRLYVASRTAGTFVLALT
ncbi:MAG: hypothetical protein RIG84_02745 [Roseovarius sp.]